MNPHTQGEGRGSRQTGPGKKVKTVPQLQCMQMDIINQKSKYNHIILNQL